MTSGPPPNEPPRRSYDPDRLGRVFDAEIDRLRAQVELSWNVEHKRLAAMGVEDGQRLLEPGCGPGFVTGRLATWLPRATVVAIDPDPRMLAIAGRVVGNPAIRRRITFLQASAVATGLRSDTFDGVISRYLYQHLTDPVAAAAETLRVLRPGGFHVVIEVDDGLWGLVHPEFPEFRAWHRARAGAQAGRGGDRFLGRRIWRILREAGYARIELDLFGYHSDALGIDAFAPQLAPDQFLPMVDEGLLTFDDYVRACSATQRFFASPDPYLLMVGFIARAEKPR